jgi:hypothetical protein
VLSRGLFRFARRFRVLKKLCLFFTRGGRLQEAKEIVQHALALDLDDLEMLIFKLLKMI